MSTAPYRIPEPPDAAAQPPIEERLGTLRSVHGAPPLLRTLATACFAATLVVGIGLYLSFTDRAFLLCLPFAAIVLVLLAWSPLRARSTVVRLYANGLTIAQRASRDAVLFDDVDELWYELETVSTLRIARVHALRLVDHSGRSHRVPLAVADGLPLATWTIRSCSTRLLPEARRAFRAGEVLTFGKVSIDRERITIGRRTMRWSELRLVRLQSGRIAFFRRQPIFPWRVVSLDRVPHPQVFATLIAENASRVENDAPFGMS